MNLGISGRLTRASIRSPLTPLLLLAALALGLVAVLSIPREEDPQIHVPMVDILVNASGLKAPDAVQLVTKPLETIVKGIQGVRHVYSQTVDDQVMVTARFAVGTNEDTAVLRVNEKVRDNYGRIPVGIPPPAIIGRGINDVAIVVLTLRPSVAAAGRWSAGALEDLATKLQQQIIKVPDVGLTYIVGAGANRIQIEPEPERMMLRGITMPQLIAKVRDANSTFLAGGIEQAGRRRTVQAGHTLHGVPDIGLLLLTTRNGEPMYLRDVARVVVGPAPHRRMVWNYARGRHGSWHRTPAVSIAFAKRAGTNAVVIARAILAQVKGLEGSLIPRDIRVEVTRDYGRSANAKANDLLFHLGLATVSIVVLIAFAIGWREAAVTLVVIPTTILLTLFASWILGYTLNRVSLFALIFAIGILVDDAIVVVENIARHWAMHDGRPRAQAAIEAVAEVGNPTVFATLAVIAALLPMLFVSGMMGPYMAPIPVNASAAMLFSFFVAMTLAPWLMLRLSGRRAAAPGSGQEHEGALGRIYRRVAGPLLATRARAWTFLLLVGAATVGVCVLFYTEAVTVKLLPFDNKSEMQLVLDLPPGATLQDTERVLSGLARIAGGMREVKSMQAYAGTAAPFDFNGLVRHYYARSAPQYGQLQIELVAKGARSLESHAVALRLRRRLRHFPLPRHAVLRLVEPPPGPPVLATLIAEVYGPDAAVRRAVAQQVKAMFRRVPFIVDVGDSYGHRPPMLSIAIDEGRLEYFGVEQSDVYDTIRSLFGTTAVGYSHRGREHPPVPIDVGLAQRKRSWNAAIAATPVPANAIPGSKRIVQLGQVVRVSRTLGSRTIFRRDGHTTDMITAELAGRFEAPIYGMLAVDRLIREHHWGKLGRPQIRFKGQPRSQAKPSVLWEGEWEITYVTFRDMGIAFMAALLGIYVLVVAQFRSYKLPLVVLTPVPLTLIGILPGHWLFGAPFTATSMIGFIALAGIIVRNSILLVDFIRHGEGSNASLREVLLDAGAIRFKPILLTALSAMIGAAAILSDPIFQGLAISLLFGLLSSTLLTVLVIPAIYVVLRDADAPAAGGDEGAA